MKNEWQKVERITPEMVGWEVRIDGSAYFNGTISGVGKFNFLFITRSGEEDWMNGTHVTECYVRPPEPPKKKPSERIAEIINEIRGENKMDYDPYITTDKAIVKFLDEEFERREK